MPPPPTMAAADGKRKRKMSEEKVYVEPNYDPDAVSRYYQYSSGVGSKPNKSLIHNAKQHLSAIGWSFFKIPKGSKNYMELRYRSPSGKIYISLRTACKAFLTPPHQIPVEKDAITVDSASNFDGIKEEKINSLSESKRLPPEIINGSVPQQINGLSELPPEINGAVPNKLPQEIIGPESKEHGRKRSRESPNFPRKRTRFIVSCHCDLGKFVTKVAINKCCCSRDPNILVHNLMMIGGIVSCFVIRRMNGQSRDDENYRFLASFVPQSIFTLSFFLILRLLNL